MKRIIVKCKLKDDSSFEQKLSDIELDFSPVYWQHDRIYVPKNYKPHANYPRLIMRTEVRTVNEPAKYFFILRRHIEDSGVDIVEETPVADYEKLVNIILQLGFRPVAEISRRRRELSMGEGNTIYLDNIDDLSGDYAKIESDLQPGDSVQAAREDLEKTFRALGESNFVPETYFEIKNKS